MPPARPPVPLRNYPGGIAEVVVEPARIDCWTVCRGKALGPTDGAGERECALCRRHVDDLGFGVGDERVPVDALIGRLKDSGGALYVADDGSLRFVGYLDHIESGLTAALGTQYAALCELFKPPASYVKGRVPPPRPWRCAALGCEDVAVEGGHQCPTHQPA